MLTHPGFIGGMPGAFVGLLSGGRRHLAVVSHDEIAKRTRIDSWNDAAFESAAQGRVKSVSRQKKIDPWKEWTQSLS